MVVVLTSADIMHVAHGCPAAAVAAQLLEYVQWPVAALPEGRSYLNDSCEVVVDVASLSQPDRRGWWFDSATVWSAVKRGDEVSFNHLLLSITR